MSTHIEVTGWRTGTRSGSGGSGNNCVEVGAWRKSTRSGSGGSGNNCIEVAACTDSAHGVAIRDTKHREGATLATDRPEWSSFVTAIKSGVFDA